MALKLFSWISRTWMHAVRVVTYFWAPHLVKVTMVAVVVAAACLIFLNCAEQRVRIGGMLLQVVGLIAVVVGLRDTRQAFDDLPTFSQSISQFVAGRLRFQPQHQTLEAVGIATGFSASNARLRVSRDESSSMEQRVTLLEEQFKTLFDEVGTLRSESRKSIEALDKALKDERESRETDEKRIKEQLKKAIAEGIPLELVGAALVAIGIIAATSSPEISKLFGGAGACS